MRLPGKSLRSEACSGDLRLAITEVKDELQRQLKQYKNKITAKTKRGQRKRKKSLHLSSLAKFQIKKGQRIREEGI
jgi:ribosome-associated translation inhibitor RaiA